MRTWDVAVVGAGPGGAAAAVELSRRGASVLVLDRSAFPRWKVCGACLGPGALSVLEDLGLGQLWVGEGGRVLRSLLLSTAQSEARIGLSSSVALSRFALDRALVDAARSRGAEFWSEARATLGSLQGDARLLEVVRDGIRQEVAARVVLDATGLGRGLGPAPSGPDEVAPKSRVGLGAVFEAPSYPVHPGAIHMAVGSLGYVGMVRVEDGTLNVAAAVDPRVLGGSSPDAVVSVVLREAGRPELPDDATQPWRGTPPLTRRHPRVGDERILRLGDAAGYVEPFTGEGIGWALAGGRAAAELALSGVHGWSPGLVRTWEAYHRRAMQRSQRLCRALAWGLRRPAVVAAVVAALRVAPGLAGTFVRRAGRTPRPLGALGAGGA